MQYYFKNFFGKDTYEEITFEDLQRVQKEVTEYGGGMVLILTKVEDNKMYFFQTEFEG